MNLEALKEELEAAGWKSSVADGRILITAKDNWFVFTAAIWEDCEVDYMHSAPPELVKIIAKHIPRD